MRRIRLRSVGGLTTQTASGAILAVPRTYPAHVNTFRMLQGHLRPGAVVLDQQMAATLFVSTKAVEFHRSSLLMKFRVPNTALLIKTAMEMQYIN